MNLRTTLPLLLLLTLSASCVSLDVDLRAVPVPISAKALPEGATVAETEPFRIEENNVLWVHGLFGHEAPDVGALLAERASGWDRVTDFRVRQEGSFHGWLAAHLSLTLVRLRGVVIEGVLVRDTIGE